MRTLVVYTLLSLDGVAEEPGNWMFDVDQGVFDNLARVIEKQDAILLGRATYDYWVGYWPGSDVEPFAGFVNGTTKHVFTSSTPAEPCANSQVVDAPPVEYVAQLKQRDGGAIGVHGSITLAQTLLRAGVVDELRLVVAPTLAGHGRRQFEPDMPLQRLQLLDSTRTPAGNLLLAYSAASMT